MIDEIANNETGVSVRGKLNDLIDLTNSFADPDSFVIPVQSRLGISGTTGGVGYLDGIPTVDMTIGTIFALPLVSPAFVFYRLQSGTTAESDPNVIRPDDYAPVTNEKIWVRLDIQANYLYADTAVIAPAVTANNVTVGFAPTLAGHATRKDYVDALVVASAAGLDFKASVRSATTANITLSGAQTIDGVSVIAGNRVLVKDQSDATENGIYVAASGAWTRATDMDTSAEASPGSFIMVEEGTLNGDTAWVLTTNASITLGSTALVFTKFKPALADDEVTFAKMQNISTDRLIGRDTASSGDPEEIGLGASLEFSGSQTIQRAALTGDITAAANSNATALANNAVVTAKIQDAAVTYAKIQNISATQRVLGRNTAGAGVTEEVTIDQLLAWATSSAVVALGAATVTKLRSVPSTLTYAGTTDIDFDDDDVKTITLTGAVTFTTSHRASGKSKKIRIICDSTLRAFTFPAWKFMGAAAPANIAASKTAILTLDCFGTNDTDIVAGYAVEP